MSADKRTVTTDALETLGMIITDKEKRDAIHLAVDNVVAAHTLRPGEDIGLLPDGTAGTCENPVGIVDPFFKNAVKKGERFWLVVYPRKITSLRHVWEHPSFDIASDRAISAGDDVELSRKWITDFAASIEQTYNRLMAAAELWMEDEEYTYDNSESYKGHWDKFPEFWQHYAIVTGKEVPEKKRESFFTCSC